jgi:hydroxyethylthiazole kinase-like uncharacterized protein yjeF
MPDKRHAPVLFDTLPPILTPEEMRTADSVTISEIGINGLTLMEVAGRAIADAVLEIVGPAGPRRVLVYCGTGNNGGDGFVAARVLLARGVSVRIVVTDHVSRIHGDALAHYEILRRSAAGSALLGVDVLIDETGGRENLISSSSHFSIHESDVIVDGLIGTGLNQNVRGRVAFAIDQINETSIPVVAIDIPSGLCGLTGRILGSAVRANQTVVMAALKRGLLIQDGPSCTGTIQVAEIGIPEQSILGAQSGHLAVRLMTSAFERTRRIPRTTSSHKYTSGPTFVVAGSEEFTGAPVLASLAAARSGSGYVRCLCPPSIYSLLTDKLTEVPVSAWKERLGARGAGTSVPDVNATLAEISETYRKSRAVLVGPGLGRTPEVGLLILALLETLSTAGHNCAIIDADGLFALRGKREWVQALSGGEWILTPHAGEVRHLEDESIGDGSAVEADWRDAVPGSAQETGDVEGTIERAARIAKAWNCVVLLKGFPSVTASPDGRVVVNSSSHAAAATAGSGDVLAGIIAGMRAQGLDAFDAAACGIHRASSLAERYSAQHAPESMMATDLLALLTNTD